MMKGKLKQKSKKQKANAVLQKYMVAVDDFIKSKAGADEEEYDRGLRFVKKKSRKELRKEKRKMKKARMKSHYEGKKTTSSPEEVGEKSSSPADKQQLKKNRTEEPKKDVSKVQSSKSSDDAVKKSNSSKTATKTSTKKLNRLQESRKKALLEANEDEDREIKRLERCLGFKKRKNKKNLPQSFIADGLDYILGMLDSGVSGAAVYDDDDDMDAAKQKFEKLGEDKSQLLGGDDEEDEMSSEAMDEGSTDENESGEEESDEDQMVDEKDDLNENNPATSDDGSEMDEEEGATTSDTVKSETVGSGILQYRRLCRQYTRSNPHLPSSRWILQQVNTFLLICEPTKMARGKLSSRG